MQDHIRQQLEAHRLLTVAVANMADQIEAAARLAIETLKAGRKLLLLGNGGSAADAQHLAAELTGRFQADRPALPALALTTDTSALTAIANDFGFERVFARQIEALAQPGDLAIALSTSGGSANVNQALRAARQQGCRTLGLSGKTGGEMPALCDVCLVIPSDDTARIQEMHILIGHILCGACETALR